MANREYDHKSGGRDLVGGCLTLSEAEAWLQDNANTAEVELAETMATRKAANIPTIFPKSADMWGPEELASWSREDLMWRVVFLQCVLRRLR